MATASRIGSNGSSQQTDLLVIGKTGHGKSSTGNTILGREFFQVSDAALAETREVQVGWSRRFGRVIKVVDSPGFFENRLTREEWSRKSVNDMEECFLQCPRGFHALLLVFRYGNKFTEEELNTVKFLKAIFGEHFVKKHCVIIFTHGESFDLNNRKKTFYSWCMEQSGPVKDILAECNYKVLLFYNHTEEKSEEQVQQLLTLVDDISKNGTRYTNELLQRAAEEREKLIVRENAPHMREDIQARVNLLVDGLEKLKATSSSRDSDSVQQTIKTLKTDCKDLPKHIEKKDRDNEEIVSLNKDVERLNLTIANQEKILKEKEEKAKMQEQLLRKQKQLQEQSLASQRKQQEQSFKMMNDLQEQHLELQRQQQEQWLKGQRELQEQVVALSSHLQPQKQGKEEAEENAKPKSGFWAKAGSFLGGLIGGILRAFAGV